MAEFDQVMFLGQNIITNVTIFAVMQDYLYVYIYYIWQEKVIITNSNVNNVTSKTWSFK